MDIILDDKLKSRITISNKRSEDKGDVCVN